MKINYDKKTDSLYIAFLDGLGVDTVEITDGVVGDLDSKNRLIGLEILKTRDKIDLKTIIFNDLPALSPLISKAEKV